MGWFDIIFGGTVVGRKSFRAVRKSHRLGGREFKMLKKLGNASRSGNSGHKYFNRDIGGYSRNWKRRK